MQFTTIASLFAAAGLAAAAPLESRQDTASCPVTTEGDYVWKISEFYGRKPEGTYYNSLGFNIKATNGGTLDFTCSHSADKLEDHTCDRSGLLLKQKVSDDITYVATATLPNYCRAGGNGPKDFVCQGVADAYITLVTLPKSS
ncbi:unnamed protein product [Alternaria alternata]